MKKTKTIRGWEVDSSIVRDFCIDAIECLKENLDEIMPMPTKSEATELLSRADEYGVEETYDKPKKVKITITYKVKDK